VAKHKIGEDLMKPLEEQEIQQYVKDLQGWKIETNAIVKEWQFKNFSEAMVFINQVAELAEEQDHHPELFNVYNKVVLKFSTHDAGGLTTRDFRIARDIDRL
jgi:4a-hydroxytetrahydrobiopterin dehydratase